MARPHFVNIGIRLVAPQDIIVPGKAKARVMRAMDLSIPVMDVERAEQLMDYFASLLQQVFQEVENDHQAQKHAATKKVGRDEGRIISGGDDCADADPPPSPSAGPDGDSGDPLGSDLPDGSVEAK